MFSILMLVLCYFERFIFLVIALLYLVVSKLSQEHYFLPKLVLFVTWILLVCLFEPLVFMSMDIGYCP